MSEWLWHIAARKAVKYLVMITISHLTTQTAVSFLSQAGVTFDADKFQVYATGALFSALEMVRSWTKSQYGDTSWGKHL